MAALYTFHARAHTHTHKRIRIFHFISDWEEKVPMGKSSEVTDDMESFILVLLHD